ncbi:hypothetical protein L3V82_09435 [Thiotrichales bacterium 19S3-7]|nr:hypothetical protein [Thiotrichales bacterium 19S3-7]MCF6802354.1 hypothetical protein [Thiotrichales bacterium 19S3-11]
MATQVNCLSQRSFDQYDSCSRYQIIADNITSLCVVDTQTNKTFHKKPSDILYSEEYKLYSKEDIVKIAYICGQMSTQ